MRDWLIDRGFGPGDEVGLALAPGVGIGVAVGAEHAGLACDDPVGMVTLLDAELRPRWVWWDRDAASTLVADRLSIVRSWDVVTVDRLLQGRWRTSPALAWAWLHDLPADSLPAMGQLGLLDDLSGEGDDREAPVRPDGHLRPEWASGGWAATPDRLAGWASLALEACRRQHELLARLQDPARALSTARSESAAEFLCAELERDGLPIDIAEAERIIGEAVGPRPADEQEAERNRRARDAQVTRHLDAYGPAVDLRNPADVKAMLRRVAVDVSDTRAWRLEQHRHDHPVVEALLTWRKAERIATTYGYRWLDEHVADGRLRGEWSSSDGA